ncbi:MerR family transcriptional regulator [Sphingomonas abaci]|uniref:DNA-binding transcriptional MerR regulator n=1 Tax=Sphingomonas abaci TaxID=237611 RepID=A0A7W7EWL1_9SPHN|nr:MerR family transcriptional regulator [Sphingomonas abaci]MBB4616652.1 DNA-binding transcriptional MerR regulator [Sphingomonas abaci]
MARPRTTSTMTAAGNGLTLKSIGELSAETGIPHHVLRYWETRFDQLRPVTRAGNRRYYRPEHVALVKRINALLHEQGYTLRGVRHLLESREPPQPPQPVVAEPAMPRLVEDRPLQVMLSIRDRLSAALAADEARR